MASNSRINGVALGILGLGGIFVYSGIKGKGVSAVLRNIIQGKDPSMVSQDQPISYSVSTSGGSVTGVAGYAGGNSILDDAMQYRGTSYKFGGWTPTGGWDCSGFVNWVLGKDLGYKLPGGVTFSGKWHGPIASQYLLWGQAVTVDRNSAMTGDLACWPTHIGFVVSNNQMLSAYTSSYGTTITPIDGWGPRGEPLTIRRITVSV